MRIFTHFGLTPAILAGLIAMMAVTTANAQAPAATVPGNVTFTKDIAPILQEKCQTCHRAGQIAPMSLLTYQQTKAYAKEIRKRVLARTMPPWFIDKTIGIQHFQNDISLNDQQIATIAKWVDEGTPEGNAKDMPPAKVWDDSADNEWNLTKMLGRPPDLIIKGPDYTVKANFQDQWYRPSTDVGLTQPRWVRAVEMRPTGTNARRVFHHILARLYQDETGAPLAEVKPPAGVFGGQGADLMEWAIGKNYDIYRPGAGKLLMPGAKISWEYHVHSANVDITGHPELGVWLYPVGYTPKYRTFLDGFTAFARAPNGGTPDNSGLDIPPNTMQVSEAFTVLKAPARLENFQPHMHLRGKAMAMEAILPDGTTEMLSYVGDFHFQWMTNYIYTDDAAPVFPAGTVIHVTAWHDNTTGNPNNPNPNQWVGLGDRTIDEMAHAWVNVTYVTQADYEAYKASHKQGVNTMGGESSAAAVSTSTGTAVKN